MVEEQRTEREEEDEERWRMRAIREVIGDRPL
jgi:hypothetical protein